MSYRRALVARWTHRDRLAILVVAVTVAFLVGTTLLVLAAGGEAAAIAAGFGTDEAVTHHDTVADARAAAGKRGVVLPVAAVTVDGERHQAVGVPAAAADRRYGRGSVPVGSPGTLGTVDRPATHRLQGPDGSATVEVRPREGALLPPSWYAVAPDTVRTLGTTGAFVVRPTDRGSPLVGALPFFVWGTRGALRTLAAAGVGAALFVAVTIHAVSRMTVRDRRRTIRVLRATGAGTRTVLASFAVRAGAITAVGTALGYALGVVVTNAAVSVAVALGVPTSLSVAVTPTAAALFAVGVPVVVVVGAAAGALAARPATRVPPARVDEPAAGADRWLGTSLLDARTLVPTGAALTAFVTIVILVAAMAGTVAPVTGTGATVTEPGSSHPLNSRLPAGYADVLRADGVDASAEILLFGVHDRQPFPARGADYEAFATVTGATLVDGRAPAAPGEAVVGRDLAATLGVAVGDRLTVGGSTRAALTHVEVVGVFRAAGYRDDQLVVPLATGRHLAGVRAGRVHLIRADRLPGADDPGPAGGVIALRAPATAVAGGAVNVTVVLHNPGATATTVRRAVSYGDRVRQVHVDVPAGGRRTVTVDFPTGGAGNRTVAAGSLRRTIRVRPAGAVSLRPLPARAPPGATPLVRVVGPDGAPADATVVVGNRSYRTGADGAVRVEFPRAGRTRVVARSDGSRDAATVAVVPDADRQPLVALTVRPAAPGPLVRPTARATLFNPWNLSVAAPLRLEGPGTAITRSVTLGPGGRRTVTATFDRASPGRHQVRATVGDATTTATYTVRGDDRLASAIARTGRRGETGLSRAVGVAFGNLRVVVAALVALATLMAIGGTTATFASAIHARRKTVGVLRATGAGPRQVVTTVLGDAIRLGAVAALAALALGLGVLGTLSRLGYLTAYGVRLSPLPSPALAAGLLVGAVGLVALSATLATAALLGASPRALLASAVEPPSRGEIDE